MRILLLLLLSACSLHAANYSVTFNCIGNQTFGDYVLQRNGDNYTGVSGIGVPINAPSVLHGTVNLSENGTYRVYYKVSGAETWHHSDESYTIPGGASAWTFTLRGMELPPATVWKIDLKMCNKTKSPMRYLVFFGGIQQPGGHVVSPGKCFEFHYEDSVKRNIHFARYAVDNNGGAYQVFESPPITTEDAGWYTSGGGPGPVQRDDDKTQVAPHPGGIPMLEWNDAATTPATEDSLRRVGEALYDSTSQTVVAAGQGMAEVSGKLTSVQNAVQSGFVNVNGNLVAVKDAVNALNTTTAGLATGIGQVNSSVQAVGASVSGLGAKLDTGNGKLTSIDGNLGEVKTGINLLHTDNGLLLDKIGDLNETAEGFALETTLALFKNANHTDLENVRSRVAEVKDQAYTLSVDQAQRDHQRYNKLADIESKFVSAQAAYNEQKYVIEGVLAAVEGFQAEAHGDSGQEQARLDGLGNKLDQVRGSVDGLAPRVDGITNWLGAILSKLPAYLPKGSVDAASEAAEGLTWGESNGGSALAADGAASLRSFDAIGPGGDLFAIAIGGNLINANPLNAPYVAQIAAWMRYVVGWLAAFLTIYLVYDAVFKSLLASGSWQPTKGITEQTPVVGTITSLLTAGGYRLVIGAAIGAIIVFWSTWKTANISLWNVWQQGQPFGSSFGGVVTAGIALLDAVAPITTILTDMGIVLGAKMTLGAVNFARQMMVRWLPS